MAAEPRTRPVSGEPSSNGGSACAPVAAKSNGVAAASQHQTATGSGPAGADAVAQPVNLVNKVIDRFEGPLVRFAARITGNLERGRDVVQETFLRLCREPDVVTSDHLGQWLFTVCRRLAIDVRRKEKRMNMQLEGTAMCAPSPVIGLSPMEQSETMVHLLRQLAGLPANQQEVVRLKFQEGMSYKQIAAITGLSVSNVGYLLHTAVKALRERMVTRA